MHRRDFLKSTAAFASATTAARAQDRPSASNRITMGVIGTGNQGTGDMKNFLTDERVQVVAVCDLNKESPGYWDGAIAGREPARVLVEWHYARAKRSGIYKGCNAYEDFRDLLARKDIDTVLIAVPDHWHSIPVIDAARAGKDIYGEKPLSLTISEGRAIVNTVKSSNRVFQCGSQQRSDVRFRKACEIVRNGGIGKLETVLVGLPGGTPDFGHTRDRQDPEPVPEGFNYEMWLGPPPPAPHPPPPDPSGPRASPRRLQLRDVARARPRSSLRPRPLPRQLSLDSRLLRRPDHRLGRPPSRHRPMGHGHRTHRPRGHPQRPSPMGQREDLEHRGRLLFRSPLRQRRSNDRLQPTPRRRHVPRIGRQCLGQPRSNRSDSPIPARLAAQRERHPPLPERQPRSQLHRLRHFPEGNRRTD